MTSIACTCPHHDAAEPYDNHGPGCQAKMPAALSAAISALGDVMLEMQRRRLLAQQQTPMTRAILSKKALTDEQVGGIASKAFEAGVTALAKIGYPGATVHSCNPREEDQ